MGNKGDKSDNNSKDDTFHNRKDSNNNSHNKVFYSNTDKVSDSTFESPVWFVISKVQMSYPSCLR